MTTCPTCGAIDHQPIPEDEAHCNCDNGWDGDTGCSCFCPCHDENCDGFTPECRAGR